MRVLDTMVVHAIPMIPRGVVKRISHRYIAGASLSDAMAVVDRLNGDGFGVTLDVLGESAASAAEADSMMAAYRSAIDAIAAASADAELSIKPTALGLLVDTSACEARVRNILDAAAVHGIDGCIDMEDTSCTQAELDLVGRVRIQHPRLGLAVQAYLKRTYRDMDELAAGDRRVRVCKGIYVEDDSHLVEGAGRNRAAINQHFLHHVRRCFEAGTFVSIATHDEALIRDVVALIKDLNIPATAFEFQMLLGVCEPMRDWLRNAGFPVRVYVPFGADWYGYSTRRLKENPRVAGYVARAMLGL